MYKYIGFELHMKCHTDEEWNQTEKYGSYIDMSKHIEFHLE